MAGQRVVKLNRASDNGKVRRRRQWVGLGAAAGTFLAAALTPLATVPAADAGPIFGLVSGLVHVGPTVEPAPGDGGAGGRGGAGGHGGAGGKGGAGGAGGQPGEGGAGGTAGHGGAAGTPGNHGIPG